MIRRTLPAIGLLVLLIGWAPPGSARSNERPDVARIGVAAPAFALRDLDGTTHRLADYLGKTLVIEWTSPNCPFVRGCYDRRVVAETIADLAKRGETFRYVAINSTARHVGRVIPREKVVAASRAFVAEHGLAGRFPVLIDHDGAVGRLYDARTTPHVFVIDPAGVLRYHGAYTNDPTGRQERPVNYVLKTIGHLARGEPVEPSRVKPWGCSVKFRDTR